MNYRFLIVTPLVTLALFLQIFIGDASGVWINFALAVLIASAFFTDLAELLVLVLFSVLVLNWQPAFSFELLLFTVLPFMIFFLRGKIPFSPWLANVFAVFAAILILYLSFGATMLFFSDPKIFLWDVALSTAAGTIAFQALQVSLSRRA